MVKDRHFHLELHHRTERLPSLRCLPSNESASPLNSPNESRHRRIWRFGTAGIPWPGEIPHQVECVSTRRGSRRVEPRERTGMGRVRLGVDEVEEGGQEWRERFERLSG